MIYEIVLSAFDLSLKIQLLKQIVLSYQLESVFDVIELEGLNMVGDRINDNRSDLILTMQDKALVVKLDKSIDDYLMTQPFEIKLPKILGCLKLSNTQFSLFSMVKN